MRIIHLVLLLFIGGLLTGCGPSKQEVIDLYQPRFAELRQSFKSIAASLPDAVMEGCSGTLDPAPVYPEYNSNIANTDILTFEELSVVRTEPGGVPELDIDLSKYIDIYFRYFEPTPEMPKYYQALHERGDFDRVLSVQYLGVVKMVEYLPPVVTATDEQLKSVLQFSNPYTGAEATLAAYLVDVPTQTVRCSFQYTVTPSENLTYFINEGESRVDALQRGLLSSLAFHAERTFLEKMAELTGEPFPDGGL